MVVVVVVVVVVVIIVLRRITDEGERGVVLHVRHLSKIVVIRKKIIRRMAENRSVLSLKGIKFKILVLAAVLAVASHQATAGVVGGLGLGGFGGYGGGHAGSFAHGEPVVGHGGYGGYGHGEHGSIDYVAHPKYHFAYGVTDHHTGDSKAQKESRDGHHVVGEYELKEPGGNVRTVKYSSDEKGGFTAHVINSGGNDHSGAHGYGHAHSHANFHGPVVGPAHPVPVHSGHGY
ncbi:adult-specific cuticular protein ACP-20-like [Anabrus simplex]|uniref:adult-specific cuticular protein ACP-20-like n=1 Tax=Anabrus simplex TaxID=316456 RepID=UPI0035A2A016